MVQQDGNTVRSKVFSSFKSEMAHSNGGPTFTSSADEDLYEAGTETMKNESHNGVVQIE